MVVVLFAFTSLSNAHLVKKSSPVYCTPSLPAPRPTAWTHSKLPRFAIGASPSKYPPTLRCEDLSRKRLGGASRLSQYPFRLVRVQKRRLECMVELNFALHQVLDLSRGELDAKACELSWNNRRSQQRCCGYCEDVHLRDVTLQHNCAERWRMVLEQPAFDGTRRLWTTSRRPKWSRSPENSPRRRRS